VQASKLELVIHAQIARTIVLTVPPSLLAIRDLAGSCEENQ